MLENLIKSAIGALFVLAIILLSKTRFYFLAGLLPLFPTFALMSHYIIGTSGSEAQLKNVIVLGMWSIIPYFLYLAAVYILHNKTNIYYALGGGLLCWTVSAAILLYFWQHR